MKQREDYEMTDNQLQKVWLIVMFQCLFVKVEEKFVVTPDLLAKIRSRLLLD